MRKQASRGQDSERKQQTANAPSFDIDFGDPVPPTIGVSREQLDEYRLAVDKYAIDVLECMEGSGVKNEDLWIEFTCSFKEFSIRSMSPRCQIKWAQSLRKNGVNVKAQGGFARWKALQECLMSSTFTLSNSPTVEHVVSGEIARQSTNGRLLHPGQALNTSISGRQPNYNGQLSNADTTESMAPSRCRDVGIQNAHQIPARINEKEGYRTAVIDTPDEHSGGRNHQQSDRPF